VVANVETTRDLSLVQWFRNSKTLGQTGAKIDLSLCRWAQAAQPDGRFGSARSEMPAEHGLDRKSRFGKTAGHDELARDHAILKAWLWCVGASESWTRRRSSKSGRRNNEAGL
jgi:hypothetical protein